MLLARRSQSRTCSRLPKQPTNQSAGKQRLGIFFFFFLILVCFTSLFVFCIADLPHSPGVVYCHLLFRRETRIPGVAPFSFRIGIWDIFVHRGQKSYTPTAFWEMVDHSRSKMHGTCLIIIHDPGMRSGPESNRGPLD